MSTEVTTGRNGETGTDEPEWGEAPDVGPQLHKPRWWPYVQDAPLVPPAESGTDRPAPPRVTPSPAAQAPATRAPEQTQLAAPPTPPDSGTREPTPTEAPPRPREAPEVGRTDEAEPTRFVRVPPPQPEVPVEAEVPVEIPAEIPVESRTEPSDDTSPPREAPPASEPEPRRTVPPPRRDEPAVAEDEPMYIAPSFFQDFDADPVTKEAQGAAPAPVAPGSPAAEGSHPHPGSGAPLVPDSQGDFGWDFEQTRAESFEWFPGPKRRPRWVAFVIAGLLLLVIGAVWVMVLANRNKAVETPPAPPPPAPATLMSPEAAAPFRPQQVSVRSFEGRLLVSWKPPQQTDLIVGYLVIAQSREGAVQKTEVPRVGELTAVLSGAPIGPDSCVVVTTLVSAEPSMMMSRSDPVCPRASTSGTGSPASGRADPTDSSAPPGSTASTSSGAGG